MVKIIKDQSKLIVLVTFILLVGLTLTGCDSGNDIGNDIDVDESNFVVEIEEDEAVTLYEWKQFYFNVIVTNTGDKSDEQDINFSLDIEGEDDLVNLSKRTVKLDSGETERIKFDIIPTHSYEGQFVISSDNDADAIDFKVLEVEDKTMIDESTLNAEDVENSANQTQEIYLGFSQLRDEDSPLGPINWIDIRWHYDTDDDSDLISGLEDLENDDILIKTNTQDIRIEIDMIGGWTSDERNYLNLGLKLDEEDKEGIEDILEDENDSMTITIDNLNFEDANVNTAKVEIRLFHDSDRVDYKSVEFDIN